MELPLPKNKIYELAQDLDCGLISFVHTQKLEIISVLSDDVLLYAEDDEWEEQINLLKNKKDEYIKLLPISSRESFMMMEAFTKLPDLDVRFRARLVDILKEKKPFRNFTNCIDDSGDLREKCLPSKTKRWKNG